jgi:prepilin-type N-terminal cleavage/methylation domain-containing protein
MTSRKNQAGFTIFELMIATSIFAVVLVVLAAGVVSFSKSYYKGINTSKTQQVARSIVSDIGQNIQFGRIVTVKPAGPGGSQGLCVDNTLYSWRVGFQLAGDSDSAQHHTRFGLVKTIGTDCSAIAPQNVTSLSSLGQNEHELLGDHMRLGDLTVTAGTNHTYTISVKVIYGDDDVLAPPVSGTTDWSKISCVDGDGSQFCATSQLTTTVEQRITE